MVYLFHTPAALSLSLSLRSFLLFAKSYMAPIDLVNRLERLGLPLETALKFVSVLLWLQRAAEMPDLLSEILSMENGVLSKIIIEVREILGFLSSHNQPDPGTLLTQSNLQILVASRNGSLFIMDLFREKERVKATVDENFNCLSKAKVKVRVQKGTDGAESSRKSDSTESQDHVARQQSLNARNASQGYNETLTGQSSSSSFDAMGLSSQSSLNHAAPFFVPVSSLNRGLEEERCLYLTFSKGYPLNGAEIATFFRDLCNNIAGERQNPQAVETVYVHKGEDNETALFGKVVFCNPYLPKFFLGGQKEVKYFVNGKELWCKQFVSKSVRKNLIERQGENSQVRGLRDEAHCTGASRIGAASSVRQTQGMGRSSQFVKPPFVDVFPYAMHEPMASRWPLGHLQVPIGTTGVGAHVLPSRSGVIAPRVMVIPRQVGYYMSPVGIGDASPVGPNQNGGAPESVMHGTNPRGYYQEPVGIRILGSSGSLPQAVGSPHGGVMIDHSYGGYYHLSRRIIPSGTYAGWCPGTSPGMEGDLQVAGRHGFVGSFAEIRGPSARGQH